MLPLVLVAAAILPASGLCADLPGGNRVLALVGADGAEAHSQLIQGLRDAGLEVDVKGHKEDGLALRSYDTAHYDHLLLLTPRATSLGGDLTRSSILEFADAGGNVVLALSSSASDLMRSLAADLGVEVDAKGTKVYDHFSRQAAGGADDPTLVATSAWIDADAVLGSERPKAPVLFRGVAQAVPTSSELALVALSGGASAYSHDPRRAPAEPQYLPAGGAAALVTLVQARNNARAAVVGSAEMLGDALFDSPVEVAEDGESFPRSGNRDFSLAVALWTFQQRGVLVATPPRHRNLRTGEEGVDLYRVEDEVEFELEVAEVEGGVSKPYRADDVQLSFVMLDPYVRQPLVPSTDGPLRLRFKVPDVYGVFKYVVDYRRAGYSYIDLQHVVPVRSRRHDEYPRFLPAAYPYYAAALSTMAAFWLAGPALLYSKA